MPPAAVEVFISSSSAASARIQVLRAGRTIAPIIKALRLKRRLHTKQSRAKARIKEDGKDIKIKGQNRARIQVLSSSYSFLIREEQRASINIVGIY